MNKLDHLRALHGMSADEWRFWSKVDMSGDCWIWTGAQNGNGYGVCSINRKTIIASRAAYQFIYESIPPEQVVRHSCDTSLCVNPEHLILGTHKENSNDRRERGRTPKKEYGRGRPKFTVEEQRAIRQAHEEGATMVELMARYRTSNKTIWEILKRKEPA